MVMEEPTANSEKIFNIDRSSYREMKCESCGYIVLFSKNSPVSGKLLKAIITCPKEKNKQTFLSNEQEDNQT